MSIVTKNGDKGKTALFSGKKMFKDDPRIEIVGELDELCSFIGAAKCLIKSDEEKKILEIIQADIFTMGAEIAAGPLHVSKLKKRITFLRVRFLDKKAAALESKLDLKNRSFCLPGENVISSTLDVARAVARRCERKATTLMRKRTTHNPNFIIYLNRLSDLLYLLARKNEAKTHLLRSR